VVDSATMYASMREQTRRAEALGFDSFWLAEHHFHGFGGMLPSPQVIIPGLAAETARLRFGTAVALLPLHHPLRLAADYATVDVLTGGRLDFGVGVGFQKLEADNLGVSLETARERFGEHLEIILRAWKDEPLNYEGQYGSYHNLHVLPKPVQRPHPPVWMAASSTPESFAWAGERGYSLMTIGFLHDVETHKQHIELYRQAYRAAGHPPEGERVLGAYHAYAGSSAAEAAAVGTQTLAGYMGAASLAQELAGNTREYSAFAAHVPVLRRVRQLSFEDAQTTGRLLIGEPAACRETMARLREELGFTHLLFLFALPDLPYDAVLASMDRFTDQVLGGCAARCEAGDAGG
jgi:natural product biosynthesis luciferase-like monooxygenase protein